MLVKYIKYAVTFKEFCLLEHIFADFILFLFAVWVLPHTDSFTSKERYKKYNDSKDGLSKEMMRGRKIIYIY